MPDASRRNVLCVSDDLPIRTARPVHSGKVRSVYWLDAADSRRLIETRGYPIAPHSPLAVMVISDRLSAFDCLWHSETLPGVPGKGAALNAIAAHWFARFAAQGLSHHLLEMPHPMLWVVRQAQPLRIEAITRQYLTGSLWRSYRDGVRDVGGRVLPAGLRRYERLPERLFTPTTKGVMQNLAGIEPFDDAPVNETALRAHAAELGFRQEEDIDRCRQAMFEGFDLLAAGYAERDELLVDSKFELGYAPGHDGEDELLFLDEIGTPDSSRIWRREDWESGEPREYSKELFREALLEWVPDANLLLDSARMAERSRFAREHAVPDALFHSVGETYSALAAGLTGVPLAVPDRPREAMLDLLQESLALLR
jgi:phosphoribosylaminoimidazole-succinocarboxamide synthase